MRTGQSMTSVERRWASVRGAASGPEARRGSTLIVVIGMLGVLLLLGLTFFSFAAQEDQAAQYYTAAAKVTPSDADPFLFGIEQILLGARAPHYQSALYSGPASGATGLGRHSLIGLMLGGDGAPYSGAGQNVVYRDEAISGNALTPDGLPDAGAGDAFPWGRDDNFDGIPDGEPYINLSIASRGGRVSRIPGSTASGVTLPQPDVNYTYPDANNLFLAYSGTVWDDVSARWRRFVIPSFHRPQFMRDLATGAPATNWASSPAYAARVLRVHPEHVTTNDPFNGGPVTAATNRRFLTVAGAVNALGLPVNEFPFASMTPEQGVFDADVRDLDPGLSADRTTITTRLNTQEISSGIGNGSGVQYDVDNDKDGIREGVWLDLDYPVQRLADGRLYSVLFSFTIVDGDGLINVNEAGNLGGAHVDGSGNPSNPTAIRKASVLTTTPVSRSNLGMSPSEVNPGYALNADASSLADYANAAASDRGTLPMRTLYNVPGRTAVTHSNAMGPAELGNLELLSLLTGRVKFRTQNMGGLTLDGTDYIYDGSSLDEAVVTGRWGEASSLINAIWTSGSAVRLNSASDWLTGSPSASFLFPRPGRSTTDFNPFSVAAIQGDDNGNRLREIVYSAGTGFLRQTDPYLPNVLFPVSKQPVDSRGLGTFVTTTSAPNGPRATLAAGTAALPNRWPSFSGYGQLRDDTNSAQANPWESAGLSTGVFSGSASDEPNETVTEPKFARTTTGDQIFGVNELAGLHLKGTDDTTSGGTNYRLRELAPANLGNPAAVTGDLGSQRANSVELNSGEASRWPRGIRDRFTTSSWDRPQPGLRMPVILQDANDPAEQTKRFKTTALTPIDRPWEFNSDPNVSDPNLKRSLEFPPRFLVGTLGPAPEVLQPFRQELRTVFRAIPERADVDDYQFRRNLNRVLSAFWDSNQNRSIPIYRRLMPHPAIAPTNSRLPARTLLVGPDGAVGKAGFDDNGNGIVDSDGTNVDWGELGAPESDDLMPWSPVANINAAGLPTMTMVEENESRAAIQEFWARRDRQLMARDLYVLLYTIGGGRNRKDYFDEGNYTPMLDDNLGVLQSNARQIMPPLPPTTPTRPVYTDAQLEEMAQFAANYVDAMDADDAHTAFEYMRDLSNGWRLDDNPVDPSGTVDVFTPSNTDGGVAASERHLVFGVERQQLTLSEVLAIRAPYIGTTATNARQTTWDDTGDPTLARYFTYIELRNAAPTPVSLANSSWRIRRITPTAADPYLQASTISVLTLNNDAAPSGQIPGGRQFVIGTRTDNEPDPTMTSTTGRPSFFRIDDDADMNGAFDGPFKVIAPASAYNTVALQADTAADEVSPAEMSNNLPNYLDLRWSPHASRFSLTDANNVSLAIGEFFNSGVTGEDVRFVLERRMNPTRAGNTPKEDNPWVIVDDMKVDNAIKEFTANDPDMVSNLHGRLQTLKSGERNEPLKPAQVESSGMSALWVLNTLEGTSPGNQNNTLSPAQFTVIQNHFDRDYVSPLELLSLPLFGPHLLTARISLMDNINNIPRDTSNNPTGTEHSAGKKFLRPDYLVTDGGAVPMRFNEEARYDNAWYRLFEFVEVPSDRNAQVQQYLKSPRTPGKINLNTVRDAAVLAGLVDDRLMISGYDPLLNSTNFEASSRYWWLQFVKARDQRDPVTGLYLPGTAASRPFLGFNALPNHVSRPQSGIERTLLRTLAANLTNTPSYPDAEVGWSSDYRKAGYFDIDMNSDLNSDSVINFADQRTDRRQLFEARTVADLASAGGTNTVDPHTRHRLLHKVANNSTTRSNLFMVWVSVTRCEVVFDAATRTYRIGGRLDGETDLASASGDFPIERAFFVLDRSQLEEAYDPRTGTFNFRKFIKYRKTLTD